ncbi:MAG TPA: hypothetical protein DEH11_05065, partial [Actinobacteria bacterium]|nr:hypothetical protein [Actinomycetota bacterium]
RSGSPTRRRRAGPSTTPSRSAASSTRCASCTFGEYARHNGHADLLRERIDGTTGR